MAFTKVTSDGIDDNAITTSKIADLSTIDTTNLEVTNIKAKDGTAAMSIADSSGNISLGGGGIVAGRSVTVNKNLTGSTGAYSLFAFGTVQSDVTSEAVYVRTAASTAASAFTVGNIKHYEAVQGTFGSGSSVSNQYGFIAGDSLTGATANYGFYGNIASGSGRWNFYAGGTANNYFAGNVGIGTSSPGAKLDVNGETIALSGAETADRHIEIGVGRAGNGNSYVDLISDTTYTDYGARFIRYNTGANTTTRLDHRGTGELSLWATDAGALQFGTNSTERMRINSSGNVGIGTSSPAAKLDVYNSAAAATNNEILRLRYTTSTTAGHSGDLNFSNANGVIVGRVSSVIQDGNNVALAFSTYSGGINERMRIDSSGNLLMGTTSTAAVQSGFTAVNTTATTKCNIFHPSGAASGSEYLGFFYNLSQIGGITQNGTTAVAYNTSSDYRLKENIQPMRNALATVAQLNPVTYNWKADGSSGQGFIAHELQAVVPDCVTGEKDAVDAEGKPVYQGVDTSFLVATLTAAIQEQQAVIESLKSRLDAANL